MATRLEDVPPGLVVDFDINDPSLADTMQERTAELRRIGPLVYTAANGGHWIATRYEEVYAIFRDWETFSNMPSPNVLGLGEGQIPNELDPPDHGLYRQLLNPLFSPARMRELDGEIRAIVDRLIDGFIGRGRCDFVADFAHELPAEVFLALMGWPLADAPLFSDLTTRSLLGVPGGTAEESAAARSAAAGQLFDYFRGVVEAYRRDPKDDYTGVLMRTPVQGRLLPEDKLLQLFFLLLMAGLHTVQGSLSYGMLYLARDPARRKEAATDAACIPTLVEEVLRIEGQVSPARNVTHDVVVAGQPLVKGDRVMLMLCAANRDPVEFDEPLDFDVRRAPNKHLSFAAGPHKCIGAHLARMEMSIAYEVLLRRLGEFEVDDERPVTFHASQVRGVMTLPLRFPVPTS